MQLLYLRVQSTGLESGGGRRPIGFTFVLALQRRDTFSFSLEHTIGDCGGRGGAVRRRPIGITFVWYLAKKKRAAQSNLCENERTAYQSRVFLRKRENRQPTVSPLAKESSFFSSSAGHIAEESSSSSSLQHTIIDRGGGRIPFGVKFVHLGRYLCSSGDCILVRLDLRS